MMTDEDTPNSTNINSENSPDAADKKGQMLVIYLPEGSVIVDRTDIDPQVAPQAVIEHVAPKVEQKVDEPVVEEAPAQQLQPTLQEVVALVVAEVMQITGQASKPIQNEQPIVAKVAEEKLEQAVPFTDYPAPATNPPTEHVASFPRLGRRVHVRRRRRLNWVSGINTALAAYLVIATMLPPILSSEFGLAIYASKIAHPDVLIAQGDLMVAHSITSSSVKVNDVLLVRDSNSWRLDARKVISNISNNGVSTITAATTGAVATQDTYLFANNALAHEITRVIPKLGYVPMVLSSTIVKVIGGLSILFLNLWVHFRRSRRRRLETVIR